MILTRYFSHLPKNYVLFLFSIPPLFIFVRFVVYLHECYNFDFPFPTVGNEGFIQEIPNVLFSSLLSIGILYVGMLIYLLSFDALTEKLNAFRDSFEDFQLDETLYWIVIIESGILYFFSIMLFGFILGYVFAGTVNAYHPLITCLITLFLLPILFVFSVSRVVIGTLFDRNGSESILPLWGTYICFSFGAVVLFIGVICALSYQFIYSFVSFFFVLVNVYLFGMFTHARWKSCRIIL